MIKYVYNVILLCVGGVVLKERISFSVDKGIKDRLNAYCKDRGISMSTVLTIIIYDFLKDKGF